MLKLKLKFTLKLRLKLKLKAYSYSISYSYSNSNSHGTHTQTHTHTRSHTHTGMALERWIPHTGRICLTRCTHYKRCGRREDGVIPGPPKFNTLTPSSVVTAYLGVALVRPTRFNLEIRSTRPLNFGSRIGFGVILPIRRGLLWV